MKGNWSKAIIPATLLALTAALGAPTSSVKASEELTADAKSPAVLTSFVKAPGGLTAAVTTKGTVILTWTADSTPSSFTIQRLSFPIGLATYRVSGGVRTFTQSGLPKGQTYHYRVRAETLARSSDYSPVVDVAVP